MPDHSKLEHSKLDLASEFPPVSTATWEAAIHADLKGADYDKRLVWRTEEGIKVKPYYRSEDIAGLEAQADVAPGEFPFTRGKGLGWVDKDLSSIPAGAIRGDLLHEAGATAIEELGFALAEGVDKLAAAVDAGQSVDQAAGAVQFVFGVGSNYFLEIAKFRAARLLWAQAVSAFGPSNDEAALANIHAVTALENKSIYDPWTNLLRSTTEAVSAVVGGCDALTVQSFHYPERLAHNVHLVVREEAHLAKVADPAGGSYYIEALTHALAEAAWKLFQKIEADGGFAAAKSSGSIDAALQASHAAKIKAVGSRRRTLVGVNNYPNVGEHLPAGESLEPAGRLAEPFEQIRQRTERHTAKTGHRLKVLLLNRGDLKMRMARAQFTRNYIGCAGFEVAEGTEYADAGADLIVLCSSDPEYLEFAKDVCPKVKVPVIVAGNPKDQIEALQKAGVSGFVHMLANAVETLTELQNRLGMEA
jgi:methylmalonyl-CoA mutase